MKVTNILDPDQARPNAGSDLSPNCLKTLNVSADDKSSREGRKFSHHLSKIRIKSGFMQIRLCKFQGLSKDF